MDADAVPADTVHQKDDAPVEETTCNEQNDAEEVQACAAKQSTEEVVPTKVVNGSDNGGETPAKEEEGAQAPAEEGGEAQTPAEKENDEPPATKEDTLQGKESGEQANAAEESKPCVEERADEEAAPARETSEEKKIDEGDSQQASRGADGDGRGAAEAAPATEAESTTRTDTDELFRMHCEADPYADLVKELRADPKLVRMHRAGLLHLRKLDACFSGSELVDWLVKNKGKTRPEAVEVGKELLASRYICHVPGNTGTFGDSSGYWRLIEDESSRALNAQYACEKLTQTAEMLAVAQEKLVAEIFEKFLSQNGKALDYKGVEGSEPFKAYLSTLGEMKRVDLSTLSRAQLLSFNINLYNMLVIHANIVSGSPRNTWQRLKFFNTVRYTMGGHTFCLQDIENGILRGNRLGYGALKRQFSAGDPRLALAMDPVDRRIHFALVCGAVSCPRLRAYSGENIENELEVATREFLDGDGCQVNTGKKQVSLSRILSWYGVDFGANKLERLRWVAENMTDGEKKESLSKMLDDKSYKLTFQYYDWSLNTSNTWCARRPWSGTHKLLMTRTEVHPLLLYTHDRPGWITQTARKLYLRHFAYFVVLPQPRMLFGCTPCASTRRCHIFFFFFSFGQTHRAYPLLHCWYCLCNFT